MDIEERKLKAHWWKRLKIVHLIFIIGMLIIIGLIFVFNPTIGFLGSIASLIGVIFAIYPQSSKKASAKEKKSNDYYHNLLERQELKIQGHPIEYINGLGENPLLKHHFEKGQSLSKESHFEHAIKEFKKCLSHPKALESNKVAAYILLGNCYYSLSRIKKAQSHYIDALKMSGKVNDRYDRLRGKSAALGNIGLIYRDLGKPDEAFKYHKEALEIHRKIGYEQGIANAMGNIALIYSDMGKKDETLKNLKDALEIHRKIGNEQGIASDLGNIGVIYHDLGKPDEALKYHKEAMEIHRKIGYEQGIANAKGNIGIIYRDLGKPDEALKYHQDALAIHRKIGYEQGIASDLGNIGLIYSDLGKPDEALKYLKDALAIDRKIGYEQGIANQLGNIGLIYSDLGKPEALKYLKESLDIFKRIRAIQQVEIVSRAIESIEKMKK